MQLWKELVRRFHAHNMLPASVAACFLLSIWFGFGHGNAAMGEKSAGATSDLEVTSSTIAPTGELPAPSGETGANDPSGATPFDDALQSDPAIVAQQTAYASSNGARSSAGRIIRVGLSTKGGPIMLWSRSPMLVSDGAQLARRLTIPASTTVTFNFVPLQTLNAHGVIYSGQVQITLRSGTYGAWREPRIWVAGGPTHVSSNGEEPRYQRAYHGSFEVSPQASSFEPAMHKSPLRLVNIVSLDDYLRGVVPWEMDADAPLEALKVQAICARSESLAKIVAGRHAADGYDICDYDHCQGYSGTENEKPASDRAVKETAGLVLFHDGHIADAVYGTNSGGITADKNDVWTGGPETHLQSVHDFSPTRHAAMAQVVKPRMTEADWVKYCTRNLPSYAQPSTAQVAALERSRRRSASVAARFQDGDLPEFYRWTRVYSPADMAAAKGIRAPAGTAPIAVVTELRVLDRAPSGHIKRLAIFGRTANGAATSVILTKDSQVRSLISGRLGSLTALPSSTFVVLPRRDGRGNVTAWVLKGAGWGHGAGMCQRGAQNHALEGWNVRQIINHYYHGIEIRKID